MFGEALIMRHKSWKGFFRMENNALLKKTKIEVRSFFEEAGRASEPVYLGLLSLYIAIFFILKTAWRDDLEEAVNMIKYGALGIVMWGSAIYLFFIIAAWKDLWKKNILLIVVGSMLLALTWLFSRRMTNNLYGVLMDIFFCLMAYKKDYRKILRCILGVAVFMMLIAGIGMAAGITLDIQKPHNVSPGHSLGIIYPNTWGYLAFLVMLLIWYLFLRRRRILTFLLFWAVSLFMYYYISCRTITGFSFAFPVFAVLLDWFEKRTGSEVKIPKFAQYLIILIPMIAFGVMLFISMQVEWVHKHFYYGPLHNFAMRFVQGGLYFRTYGFPLVGNPYRSNQITYINVNNVFEKVGILDSSFAAYIIMRGVIWMTCVLLWLCLAHWKALKKKDYAIPLLETFILLFAMMERPGLEMWYNFVMLYPLAKVFSRSGTEKHPEHDAAVEKEPSAIED